MEAPESNESADEFPAGASAHALAPLAAARAFPCDAGREMPRDAANGALVADVGAVEVGADAGAQLGDDVLAQAGVCRGVQAWEQARTVSTTQAGRNNQPACAT